MAAGRRAGVGGLGALAIVVRAGGLAACRLAAPPPSSAPRAAPASPGVTAIATITATATLGPQQTAPISPRAPDASPLAATTPPTETLGVRAAGSSAAGASSATAPSRSTSSLVTNPLTSRGPRPYPRGGRATPPRPTLIQVEKCAKLISAVRVTPAPLEPETGGRPPSARRGGGKGERSAPSPAKGREGAAVRAWSPAERLTAAAPAGRPSLARSRARSAPRWR
jgi:hypothetical protein